MQDPEFPKSGWTPTNSTLGGAILGGALGQIVVASFDQIFHITISLATAGAINTVCIFAVGYFFPDGGRK